MLPLLATSVFGLTGWPPSCSPTYWPSASPKLRRTTWRAPGRTGSAVSRCWWPAGCWPSRFRCCSSGRPRGLGGAGQRGAGAARADVVDDGGDEDRPGRSPPARPGDGFNGPPATARWRSRPGWPVTSAPTTACGRTVPARPELRTDRPRVSAIFVRETATTPGRRPPGTRSPTPPRPSCPTGRSSGEPPSPNRRCHRPVRPGWSTTSTSGCPGHCSLCCSPPGTGRRPHRSARRGVPGSMGLRSDPHRGAVGSLGPQTPHHRRHAHPQAVGLMLIATGETFGSWLAAGALLGAGTRDGLPTLLAVIGDVAHPLWRARSVGVYRLWRDGGIFVGRWSAVWRRISGDCGRRCGWRRGSR